jgi:cell division protein FtsA
MGALVIDIGSGTTEYVVYADGIIKHTGVLAVGGDHVSNDLAYGLKVPLGRGEQLKIEHGSALMDESCKGQVIRLANEFGVAEKSVNLEHLRKIMSLRLEEIFDLIAQDLEAAGMLTYLREGVFLCGGGARIPGIEHLAGQVFGIPAIIGTTTCVSGLKSALNQPEFATAIGLVRYGSFQMRKRQSEKNSVGSYFKRTINQVFRRA